jgi:hypothetical protein
MKGAEGEAAEELNVISHDSERYTMKKSGRDGFSSLEGLRDLWFRKNETKVAY